MSDRGEDLLSSRRAKLDRIRQRGIDPFPPRFRRTCTNEKAVTDFQSNETAEPRVDGEPLSLAGRITSVRGMGKATFMDLRDGSGRIQAHLRRDLLQQDYELLKDIDLGDFLGVTGPLFRTRTGEVTIQVNEVTILAKALRPPPEKWHGLKDVEQRYRQRYVDLVANLDVKRVFIKRSRIIKAIRYFLDTEGFVEVDTPVLVPVAAGAFARPFVTHYRALDQTQYLRIATELYLKRLIVGGFDKVYELGRVFRNEGIDQDHNPEYSLLESYEAYADYNDVMRMVEDMVSAVAMEVLGKTQVEFCGQTIELAPPWNRVNLHEELQKYSGLDIDEYSDSSSLANKMKEMGVEMGQMASRGRLLDKLISNFVEPNLIQPTFLLDYPEEMSPLAKRKDGTPGYVERFEGFVGGMEIANSFTELNDPDIQRQRFMQQEELRQAFQDEEVDRMDADFILALEYGMPPTGGLGMGIDRLVMLLTEQRTIRDVVLFPQLRNLAT